MESAENNVQTENKENLKDVSEKVETEKTPTEVVEKAADPQPQENVENVTPENDQKQSSEPNVEKGSSSQNGEEPSKDIEKTGTKENAPIESEESASEEEVVEVVEEEVEEDEEEEEVEEKKETKERMLEQKKVTEQKTSLKVEDQKADDQDGTEKNKETEQIGAKEATNEQQVLDTKKETVQSNDDTVEEEITTLTLKLHSKFDINDSSSSTEKPNELPQSKKVEETKEDRTVEKEVESSTEHVKKSEEMQAECKEKERELHQETQQSVTEQISDIHSKSQPSDDASSKGFAEKDEQSLRATLDAQRQYVDREALIDQTQEQRVPPHAQTETSGLDERFTRREFLDERTVQKEIYERGSLQDSAATEGPKQVDLQKIFTPATDGEEILPKNRKLYASSAFYSPGLHPTVEDQVELARKISHSLSDSNNHQSKGQSMYVNRKKRSVKWVHDGDGEETISQHDQYDEESKENQYENRVSSSSQYYEKVPLKLVMDPRGQIQDLSSTRYHDLNVDPGMLSPEICADLVSALHAPKGKGAELFAKRRKKSEKWIVDEQHTTNAASQNLPDITYGQSGVPLSVPLQYSSFDAQYPPYDQSSFPQKPFYKSEPFEKVSIYPKTEVMSSSRDLAYKPSIPRGWNAPPPSLPKGLYTPPGIPLDSYIPPPTTLDAPLWTSSATNTSQSPSYFPSVPSYAPEQTSPFPSYDQPTKKHEFYSPPKANYSPPTLHSFRKPTVQSPHFNVPQSNIQRPSPTISFNPSPIPYEKLEKFDRPSSPPDPYTSAYVPHATFKSQRVPVPSNIPPKSKSLYQMKSKYETYQSEVQEPPPPRSDIPTAFPPKSAPYQAFDSHIPPISKVSPVNMIRCHNFNTAPRGWNQTKEYYRPVTFGESRTHLSYTDF